MAIKDDLAVGGRRVFLDGDHVCLHDAGLFNAFDRHIWKLKRNKPKGESNIKRGAKSKRVFVTASFAVRSNALSRDII
jgi:hypothetical protein